MGLNLSSSAQYSRVSAAVVVDMVIELLVMIASSPWRKGVGGRVLVDGSDDVASSKDRGGGGEEVSYTLFRVINEFTSSRGY